MPEDSSEPPAFRCIKCKEVKHSTEFCRNKAQAPAQAFISTANHVTNQVVRTNRLEHRGSTRSFHLRRRYRVDGAQVAWMILQQGGVSALCHTGKPEHVDHDHRTDRVRGILCFNCNRGLGKFGDDVELMDRAIEYLESVVSR